MANIFGILTSLVLIVAVIVAAKNKSLYETEIENVVEQKRRLGVSQERLDVARAKLEDLNTEIPVVKERTAELIAKTDEQRGNNETTEANIASKNDDVSRNRGRISELQQTVGSFGNVDQLVSDLRSVLAQLEELKSADEGIPALTVRLERLTSTANRVDADNATTQSILEGYTRGESRPGMSTRIRSIYPSWGFVTLADGGISGVAGNSTMDVIRGNEIIAKLQVTAVEPNSASATIVPGSIDDDVTLAVGDTVVPGTRMEMD